MKKSDSYNFTKQLGIYAGVTLLFMVLVAGSGLITWNLGNSQQMFVLVNIVMSLGFIFYLNSSGLKLNFNPRISDRKALYWICLWISIIVLAQFYRPDLGWADNVSMNVWLIIECLVCAAAEETVFRSFGDLCFREKGHREIAAMIICSSVYYIAQYMAGVTSDLLAILLAVGMSVLFTGMYLRFRKLGANIVYHFILIYLMRVTILNSTSDVPVLGKPAPFVFALGVLGMIWYGVRLISAFERDGVSEDEAGQDDLAFARAFTESRDKYKEKVINKAQPSIDRSNERRQKKLEDRIARQEAKQKEKENRKK